MEPRREWYRHECGARKTSRRRNMARKKPLAKKLRLIERGKKRPAPRWADIKKFGLKHARTRRIQSGRTRNWRRGNTDA